MSYILIAMSGRELSDTSKTEKPYMVHEQEAIIARTNDGLE